MKIDLRNVYTQWVNLDEKTDNAQYMQGIFKKYGFENTHRFSAVRKTATHENVRPGEEHYPGIAESQIACMKNILDRGEPGLILEDDIGVNDNFSPVIEIPDDADAFYLGTSHGDQNYDAVDLGRGDGICKISRMLSAHSILHISDRWLQRIQDQTLDWMYATNRPFDVHLYSIQAEYNVYAFHTPFFYQADERDSSNKWENLTKEPLNTKKKSVIHTIGY